MSKYVSVKCSAPDRLPLNALSQFNERLKTRTTSDVKALANDIAKNGFHCPFFVWKSGNENKILDGNGRYLALSYLQEQGYVLPCLPVVFVEADDERQARLKVLELNNINGQFSLEQFIEYTKVLNLDYSEVHIPGLGFSSVIDESKNSADEESANRERGQNKAETKNMKGAKTAVCPHCGAEVVVSKPCGAGDS